MSQVQGLYSLASRVPDASMDAWVAPNATVIGSVHLAAHSSVWFQAVLRGDNDHISIGSRSNVQDGCVIHTDPGYPVRVEENVTIGHHATIHGCTLRAGCLIGIGAIILNAAEIGEQSLIGAGSLVTENKSIPPRTLAMGVPAKPIRELTEREIQDLLSASEGYWKRARYYSKQLARVGEPA